MDEFVSNFRNRLTEYRVSKVGFEVSIHINALEIAINLAEFSIRKDRVILQSEEIWFNADWELINVFENSKWEDLLHSYFQLKELLKKNNYLKLESS